MLIGLSLQAQSLCSMHPHEARKLINQNIMSIEAEVPAVANVCEMEVCRDVRTTPIRLYTPCASGNLPVVMLIHGGGWVAGNLDTHDNLARYLCRGADCLVVSVGYQNSPEGKFPLPLEQCYDVLLWMAEHVEHFGGDPRILSVVGDSAGGNMAAALCLMARDRQGPCLSLQVLINPATDLTSADSQPQRLGEHKTLRWFAKQYIECVEDVYNPYVSPLCAQDLSHLPPAVVILAQEDPLFEDGQRYAQRLHAAGVCTVTYIQPNIGHLGGYGARAAPCAQESLNVAVKALCELKE
ncbi:MAG: alpha/beta hydrolase [Verrucomicrobia bacterium]|nr:alpha/beta hydrolase [Verrucomicrobiota bacterium]